MSMLHTLFGFNGRLGRTPFFVCLIAVGGAFYAGINGSYAALPAMAQVLGPRGINAGLVLNVVWSLVWLLTVWSSMALVAKRLHDRGRSGWWAAAVVLPLAALAQINDAIFLVSRNFTLPSVVQYAIIAICGALALWVAYETIGQPSSEP